MSSLTFIVPNWFLMLILIAVFLEIILSLIKTCINILNHRIEKQKKGNIDKLLDLIKEQNKNENPS